MGKQNDIDDILGGEPTPKTKAKKDAPAAKPAAKASKATTKPAKEEPQAKAPAKEAKEPKVRAKKEPVVFEDGEQEDIIKKAKKIVAKGDINSRELASKLGIATRKLRPCLYVMSRAGDVVLTPGESRVHGMTVSPAA